LCWVVLRLGLLIVEKDIGMRRYYEGHFNPYNRHDTGMYCVYRKSDGKYIGTVVDCNSESHAERVARNRYGYEVYVDLIEE
jgi:hypothetical protein